MLMLHVVVNFIIIDLALRMLGHVALLKCKTWTASVTDPLLYAIASRLFKFIVQDPAFMKFQFAQFNSIYTKSKKLTSEFHVLLKLQRRKRGD